MVTGIIHQPASNPLKSSGQSMNTTYGLNGNANHTPPEPKEQWTNIKVIVVAIVAFLVGYSYGHGDPDDGYDPHGDAALSFKQSHIARG
jgi:hypothetical protein